MSGNGLCVDINILLCFFLKGDQEVIEMIIR